MDNEIASNTYWGKVPIRKVDHQVGEESERDSMFY
jgi:hypothetical protein